MGRKILIFGLGKKYNDLKTYIDSRDVIAFLDNKAEENPMVFEGKYVYNPCRIPQECRFDAVLITSVYYFPIKRQLMALGIRKEMIYSLFQIGELQPANLTEKEEHTLKIWKRSSKRFLLVQHDGGGGGATIALSNLALALAKKYNVLVTFPTKGEMISFYESHQIPYICNMQMNCDTEVFSNIILEADVVLVNAVINNNVIEMLHRYGKPFYLWLHDHQDIYDHSDCECLKECMDHNVKLLAVSPKAMELFTAYIKSMPCLRFPLAIQDSGYCVRHKKANQITTIAVIGELCRIKGQDILLDALEKIKTICKVKLIGGTSQDVPFANMIAERCEKKNYECTGHMTNREIHELYCKGEIQILICPSRFETMSISSVEAMSYGIPIIVSDRTGIAEYVKEMGSYCIFESENRDSLAEKIERLLIDPQKRKWIGGKMRVIYKQYFSMEELEKRCNIFDRQEVRLCSMRD